MLMHVIREPNIELVNPTIADIHAMMQEVSQDDGDPLIILKTFPASGTAGGSNELWIARLNVCDEGSFAGWLVRHKTETKKSSVVLATATPTQEAYQRYELFGAYEDIRPQCLAPQSVIDRAIQYFLIAGGVNPSLNWLDFLQCVRSV